MTKQDIIERAKRVSFSSNPKDYIEFVGELAKENETIPEDVQEAAKAYEDSLDYHECMSQWPSVGFAAGMLAERERLMKKGDDGLEKMIDDFEDWDGSYSRADLPTSYTTRDIARFFANWQRERMMKEAEVVEGIVCGRVADHINIKVEGGDYLTPKGVMHILADKSKYEIGDKVKLIILK